MKKLERKDLWSLEDYSQKRIAFREQVMRHKENRKLHVGPHVTLLFEDRLTVQYQIQEMLRVERIFEAEGIQDELDAYNPLIPDGANFKATLLIEFPDAEERRRELARLIGIEDRIWLEVQGQMRVFAVADEDLERENEEKTSSVHFLRFDLTPAMVQALKQGAPLNLGIDHPRYRHAVIPVAEAIRASLCADLD